MSAPPCDSLDAVAAGRVDCELQPNENVLLFDFGAPDADGTARLTVIQTAPEGGTRRISDPVAVGDVRLAPGLRDINSNGVPELLIPIVAGMVTTTFAVWVQDADGFYTPVGAIAGPGIDAFDVDGPVVTAALRDNAATWIETAQMVRHDRIVPVYRMAVDYAERTCALIDDSGMVAAALDPDDVLTRCAARDWEAAPGPDPDLP